MKNRIIKGVLGACALMLLVIGCKDEFLDIAPTGQLAEAQLSSRNGIDASLIAAYSVLNGRFNREASASNWAWGSIRGGDAVKGTDPGDYSDLNPIMQLNALPSQGVVNNKYTGTYEGIARANNVLRLLQTRGADVSDDDATGFEAQAKFLRGHYYFELKRTFGDTPYVTEVDDYGTGIELIPNNQDLYPFIEADLQFAYDYLPETQDQVGRVNKWAAASLLAKVYMYQDKFVQAKTLFDEIIADGQTSNGLPYGLVPQYADVFKASNDNHEESVWAYQSAANTGHVNNANPEFDLNWPYNTGPDGPGNCCGFFQPTTEMANSFRTSTLGLPLLDKSYNTAANAVASDMGLESDDAFTPDTGNLDPRIDHSIGRRGIPYLDWIDHPGKAWIRDQNYGGPWSPKKYVYYRTDVGVYQDNTSWTPGYAAMNVYYIRYADVLLMAAEAEIEVGSLLTATDYVNQVRARAANPAGFVMKDGAPAANYVISEYLVPFATQAAARDAVRFERKLELSGEGHRFYDLVRWGVAEEELNEYLAYESAILPGSLGGGVFNAGKDELLPIPQPQIDLIGSDILQQNPGY